MGGMITMCLVLKNRFGEKFWRVQATRGNVPEAVIIWRKTGKRDVKYVCLICGPNLHNGNLTKKEGKNLF